jgi:lysophospholipase L1-like esterase
VSTWISRLVVALLALPLAAVAVPAHAAAPTVAAPIRIMPLGDSITFCMGSTTGSGYRAELWRRLVEQSGYGVDLVGSARTGTLPDIDHEGHSGWTIAQLSDSADGWLAAATPVVVLLHIGTNDIRHEAGSAGAADRLSALIDRIRTRAPNATLLVATIIGANESGVNARVNAYNQSIPGIVAGKGDPKVRLVPMNSALVASDLMDWLHPNDGGDTLRVRGRGRPVARSGLSRRWPVPSPGWSGPPCGRAAPRRAR